MRAFRRHRVWTGWIAAMAILLAALAPAVTHALQERGSAGWVEVCTASGTSWVQADGPADAGSGHGGGVSHAYEHCPLCTLYTPMLGLPPAGLTVGAPPRLTQARPAAFWSAPRTLHAWRSAQPRAPPLFS